MHRRGASVAEVLHYLFGPGEYRDHGRQRVIAAWAYATVGGVDELQPATTRAPAAAAPSRVRPQRRSGRVILYHRHIDPVLVRDWSIRMDLFTATVAASADTWKFRNAATRQLTAKDARELITAEYLRRIPAQSEYLDTAVSPAP